MKMSFVNTMLCYYFSLEVVLQGVAKNSPTEKQNDAEIQPTLKHVRRNSQNGNVIQIAKRDLNYKLQRHAFFYKQHFHKQRQVEFR